MGHGRYNFLITLVRGIDLIRQILTSKDSPAAKGLRDYKVIDK